MTNEQIYIKAHDIISQRRQRAVTLMQERENRIVSAIPSLLKLKNERIIHGIALAKASVTGKSTAKAAEEANALKEIDKCIAELLEQNGYSQNCLEPEYTCKNCNDTGRKKDGKMCECVHTAAQQLRREELAKVSPISLCSFNSFSLLKYPDTTENNINIREYMSGILDYCKAYAEDFSENSQSLYMCGSAGLGKTHLALSIADIVLKKGYNVLYVSAQSVFDSIEREHFTPVGKSTLESLLDAELLILDDLGTEYITPYIGSCLYDIINTRWNKHVPTIYTSNFVKMEELSKRYTEKIVSRLMGSCETLHFLGEDIRIINK